MSIENFAAGLVDGAVQQPCNALIEVLEHVSGKRIGKVDVVKPDTHDIASTAGELAGKVLDVYLLSKAVGSGMDKLGVASTGVGASALRMGTTGAIYGGLLEPTQPDQRGNFFYNRLANAATEGATWAAMGATQAGIEKSGFVTPRPFRSLIGNVAIGVASGVAGGAVHAETNSLLNHWSFAPAAQLGRDVKSYAIAGGVFGAFNYAQEKITQSIGASKTPTPSKFTTGEDPQHILGTRDVSVARDVDGNITGVSVRFGGPMGEKMMYVPDGKGAWETHYSANAWPTPTAKVGQLADGTVVTASASAPLADTGKDITIVDIYPPNAKPIYSQIQTPHGTALDTPQQIFDATNAYIKDWNARWGDR